MASTRFTRFCVNILGIELVDQPVLQEFEEPLSKLVHETYHEQEPTVSEYFRSLVPTKRGAIQYIYDLFPSAQWLPRYNWRWLVGDSIAGLTIGFVVVPQALAYALLAGLSPEYGLYTSFAGAATYFLFGTSKDIVIGTTAVGSLLVGSVVTSVEAKYPDASYSREDVAKTLSFIIGVILLPIGLLRLGWLIEFIPYVPISAFVTAASITIISTQLSSCLGIKGINTHQSPYKVILQTLEGLPRTQLDAAIGLSCLLMLFAVRDMCAKLEVKQPSRKRLWAAISSLRMTFAMLFYTLVSFLVHRTSREHPKFRLVGHIDGGFQQAGPPRLESDLVSIILPELPPIVIILVIEHIAIAKSFGRSFGYTVIPSQEILAQGTANFLGPFLGGYACTGSFSASAVLSKAGVRTPLAGLFSALVLILALYALTGVFYYIPEAALAALIGIHATCNLLTPPKSLYRYWQLSPFELIIWIAGVVLAVFTNLETSIYCTIILSLVLLLVRLARTRGQFLGQVQIGRVELDIPTAEDKSSTSFPSSPTSQADYHDERGAFLPIDRTNAPNPHIEVSSPYSGVFIYRFAEGFNYLNQVQQMDNLTRHILTTTRPTSSDDGLRPCDRLWNDPGPNATNSANTESCSTNESKPTLKAIILDCAAVNNMDITSIQGLIDTRNFLDKYASPSVVEWHFANVHNRWTRRALATAGFGFPVCGTQGLSGCWRPCWTVSRSFAGPVTTTAEFDQEDEKKRQHSRERAMEEGVLRKRVGDSGSATSEEGKEASTTSTPLMRQATTSLVYGMDRPFFHIDLVEAVDCAVRGARRGERFGN